MSPKGYKYVPSIPQEKVEVPEHLKASAPTTEPVTLKVDKPTPTPVATPQNGPQTFVVKTEIDAYINERLQTQPASLDEVEAREIVINDGSTHVLSLPKEIKDALESRGMTAFWINKKKKAIDHAISDRGWTIFTRVYFPSISRHHFTANGTVETGDCILGFMPIKNAEILRKRPGQISQERVNSLPINRFKESKGDEKIGYYKPAYTAEPDGQVADVGKGLYAQPDVPSQE